MHSQTSRREQQVINNYLAADTTCNVLPTTQFQVAASKKKGAQVVTTVREERLIRISTQVDDGGANHHHCAKIDYKLVHERGLAKELFG